MSFSQCCFHVKGEANMGLSKPLYSVIDCTHALSQTALYKLMCRLSLHLSAKLYYFIDLYWGLAGLVVFVVYLTYFVKLHN